MNFCELILQYPLSVWFCLASFRDGIIFCFLCFGLMNWPFWIFLNFFPCAVDLNTVLQKFSNRGLVMLRWLIWDQ